MASGDVYEVTIIGNLNGQVVNNVLHAREVAVETHAVPAEACARGWFADVSADWVNCLAESYQIAGVYARRISPTPSIPYLHIPASGHTGLEIGEAASTTGAGVLSLYTAVMSKSGRGRIYMPAVAEGRQSNGVIDSTQITNYQTLLDTMIGNWLGHDGTNPTAGSWTLAVWSPTLLQANDVILGVVQPNMGTIRGRRAPRLNI
jgi:hypothetical protein